MEFDGINCRKCGAIFYPTGDSGVVNICLHCIREIHNPPSVGTCGGCGAYGVLGRTHNTSKGECGEFV